MDLVVVHLSSGHSTLGRRTWTKTDPLEAKNDQHGEGLVGKGQVVQKRFTASCGTSERKGWFPTIHDAHLQGCDDWRCGGCQGIVAGGAPEWPVETTLVRNTLQPEKITCIAFLGWHVCRTKFARKIWFDLRNVSRKMLWSFLPKVLSL